MWLVGKLIVLWWGGLEGKLSKGSHDGALGVVTVGDQGLVVASKTKYGAMAMDGCGRWSARLE